MSDLTPITPKLCKLIPRLASDQDGEVVATVRAIQRMLAAEGMDLHDLAAAIDRPSLACCSAPAVRHWACELQAPADWLDFIWNAEHGVELTSKDSAFVYDLNMTKRHWRGGNLRVTEKQEKWLRAIYAKCRRAYDARAGR